MTRIYELHEFTFCFIREIRLFVIFVIEKSVDLHNA